MVTTRKMKLKKCNENPSKALTPSSLSFLDLPREIRDQIYRDALIITEGGFFVCNNTTINNEDGNLTWQPAKPGLKESREKVCMNLLLTCRSINMEATPIFYSNTFIFAGLEDWQMEIRWLSELGRNVDHLVSVVFYTGNPSDVWQNADGTRKRYPDDVKASTGRAHPRNPLLQPGLLPTDLNEHGQQRWEEGPVMDIDPDMETVLAMLGDGRAAAPKLTLTCTMPHSNLVPGFFRQVQPDSDDYLWFSIDLPNLMEAWRFRHSASSNVENREMDVLWYVLGSPTLLEEVSDRLHLVGWDVVKHEQLSLPHTSKDEPNVWRVGQHSVLTLRLRPHIGPIIADRPHPYVNAVQPPLLRPVS